MNENLADDAVDPEEKKKLKDLATFDLKAFLSSVDGGELPGPNGVIRALTAENFAAAPLT